MGTCVHFSRSLPSNSWWQTMVGGKSCQGRQPPKAGAAGPPLQGLPPSHTWPPRSTAGNISLAGCLKTGPQYSCVQQANNPDICSLAIPTSTLGITERADWSSFRVGVAADWVPFDRVKLSANAAWLPFVKLNATDTHALRPDLPGA